MNIGDIPTVAVVGGGAAGTLTAVHLLREASSDGVEVILVDREGEFGPGTPYRTHDPLHVLNVPASRMGGISGYPEHFHRWLWKKNISAGPDAFMPRFLFGRYLRELLDETEEKYSDHSILTRLKGEVVGREAPTATGEITLRLRDGDTIEADHVVLALGQPPSGDRVVPPVELLERRVYVPEPWARGALDEARRDEEVLIIGTGLTMVDVAASLTKFGGPEIRAVSDRGLVPRRYRETGSSPESFIAPMLADRLVAMVEGNRLHVSPGSIAEIAASGAGAVVSIVVGNEVERVQVDRIIDCFAAGAEIQDNSPALLVGSGGQESKRIQVVGGFLKGVEWEAIGIAEIRDQAARAAQRAIEENRPRRVALPQRA